jgi:hypothetical protein
MKLALLIYAAVLIITHWDMMVLAQGPKSQPTIPIYDCRQAWVQNGVRVRRLSDHRVTRIDVCGAADSSDDTFRDIPYEAPN